MKVWNHRHIYSNITLFVRFNFLHETYYNKDSNYNKLEYERFLQ